MGYSFHDVIILVVAFLVCMRILELTSLRGFYRTADKSGFCTDKKFTGNSAKMVLVKTICETEDSGSPLGWLGDIKQTQKHLKEAFAIIGADDNPTYTFPLPLTALAWRRIGVETIVILVTNTEPEAFWTKGDPRTSETQKELFKAIREVLQQLGTVGCQQGLF